MSGAILQAAQGNENAARIVRPIAERLLADSTA
jgi:hypothetical protein